MPLACESLSSIIDKRENRFRKWIKTASEFLPFTLEQRASNEFLTSHLQDFYFLQKKFVPIHYFDSFMEATLLAAHAYKSGRSRGFQGLDTLN